MADTKVSALTSDAAPGLDSLLYTVDDPAGTPASRKTTLAELMTATGLLHTAGGADAGQTMAVGVMYVVDISGYSADRTYTLPATAAVGDRCGICLSAGDTAFELLVTAAAGDTLNGIAGGTEWSRLFIQGETVIFRCVAASATWIVEHDGRIANEFSVIADGTNVQNLTTGVGSTTIHGGSGGALKTTLWDIGNEWTAATGVYLPRRPGRYFLGCTAIIGTLADGKYMAATIQHSSDDQKSVIATRAASSLASFTGGGSGGGYVLANGTTDQWTLSIFHTDAGTPTLPATASNDHWARFFARWEKTA